MSEIDKGPYQPTYDLLELTPQQVSALNKELEAGRDDAPAPVDALTEDVKQLPFIDFDKARELITFLAESDFDEDRNTAGFAIANLAIEADRRRKWLDDIALMWANLLTDDHEFPRESSMLGLVEATDLGQLSGAFVSQVALHLAEKLNYP
ncbi:MAG: hypothetical protein ACJ74U_19000 [Jatrophihabitantaceae bacterium]